MGPESLREMMLPLATTVGVIGDDRPPKEDWSKGKLVQGTLNSYLRLERHHNIDERDGTVWDIAILISLFETLQTDGFDLTIFRPQIGHPKKDFLGTELLLLQRAPNLAWSNNDPTVHVFGVLEKFSLNTVLTREIWLPKVLWLSGFATMTVESPELQSEMSKLFRIRAEKNSKLE